MCAVPISSKTGSGPNLGHRTYYFNRELSWLEFNRRVLEEALDESKPLLERAKFLSIFASNLDEFFMIRVSGLRRQLEAGTVVAPPDGMTPGEQVAAIHERLQPMLEKQTRCWLEDVSPKLRKAGIKVLDYGELKSKQRKLLRRHFKSEIYPALTPLAFDPGHPFPHISNLSINLAVEVHDEHLGTRFARVKVPQIFGRLVRIPSEAKAGEYTRLGLRQPKSANFVWLEQVVAANLDLLFPGLEIVASYAFRVTRDADFEIEEDEAADLMEALQEVVGQRHFGSVVRLEVDERMPRQVLEILTANLGGLAPYQIYKEKGPMGFASLMELISIDRPDLKDTPFLPALSPAVTDEESIFSVLRHRDVLLYHPYDSFNPVVDFVREAAADPDVIAIKITLYRVGPNSPIVHALREARENGKQVAALVELKARFDEENNMVWARALEEAGVHVVYGLLGLKVHTKMALVVRREPDGMRRYVHLGTGNYNPVTAKVYTDLGFFSGDSDLTADVSALFNSLTGYSASTVYKKLLVSPHSMRQQLLERIEREIEVHRREGGGRLIFKMNSLVDKASIRALYRASRKGVQVDLIVRGICCLRPGVERVSENIRVVSIVGRFLEHARVYYFRNGGDEELLLGSADVMPRNLDGRVELLFPVESAGLRRAIRADILELQLADSEQSWVLRSDGTYERRTQGGDEPVDSQAERITHQGSWHAGD